MFLLSDCKNKEIAVFGLGRSGLNSALALQASGAIVYAWDDNELTRENAIKAGVKLSDISQIDFSKIDYLVMSPGVPIYGKNISRAAILANENNVPIIGDIELFAKEINAITPNNRPQIIGITGTNGKSTTTALIGHILQSVGKDVRIGGNIGTGILSLEAPKKGAIYVLELSSYQLDLCHSLRLDVAIQTNISEDHLERHGIMARYTEAKRNIFANQEDGDFAIIGVDDEYGQSLCTQLMNKSKARVLPISSGQFINCGISAIGRFLWDNSQGRAVQVADLSLATALVGAHNGQNAAAAFAACKAMGLSNNMISQGLYSFPGLQHRLQLIATIDAIKFYNDSKATNADASAQALKSFAKLRWIVGGQEKSDGIDPLVPLFGHVSKAYIYGHAAKRFSQTLANIDHEVFEDLAQATNAAYNDAIKSNAEENIVLSPACASFDQYKDFEQRGDHFVSVVNEIVQN